MAKTEKFRKNGGTINFPGVAAISSNNCSNIFLERVLDPPAYGFKRGDAPYYPTRSEILREFRSRLNVFKDRRNWLALFGWTATLSFAIPLGIFLTHYMTWPLMLAGFIYSMVLMGSHGTFWLHRHGTHRAFKFRNAWITMICRNLVIKVVPEEIYIVSHHVHHKFSEQPGDPYNVHAGWLYCFLADVNHQGMNRNLSEDDYRRLCVMLEHTGIRMNTYAQFKRWGSVCHPVTTILHYAANWAAWFGIFYWIGGPALATAIFGWAGVWAVGIRTYNFEGHGRGKDSRREGIDFNREDLSINQAWPGIVAGEWHNNHHLYPNGARSGFLPTQIDLPWYFIRALSSVGAVTSFRDYREDFYRDHYLPYVASRKAPQAVRST